MLPTIGQIDSYTLMFSIGAIFAIGTMLLYFWKKAQKGIIPLLYLLSTALICVGFGLIGANLFQNLYDFMASPEDFSWSGRSTFYGGLLTGGLAFLLIYKLFLKKAVPDSLEGLLVIAPGCIALAHALGRVGCFMAGCCYGLKTDSWLGVHFPNVEGNVLPANLFEAIFLFLLAAILIFMAFKYDSKYTFPIYLLAYGAWRFFIEFFRGDDRGSFIIPFLSPSQFWSLILVVVGVIWIVKMRKKIYEGKNR